MPIREIERNIEALTKGWQERIEYRVRVGDALEYRAKTIPMAGILDQLAAYAFAGDPGPADDAGRRAPGKASSRPPGRVGGIVLLDEITGEVDHWHRLLTGWAGRVRGTATALADILEQCRHPATEEHHLQDLAEDSRRWVRDARKLLAHDIGQDTFADTVCGDCGGALAVNRDTAAATAVRCVGTPHATSCGRRYERQEWLELYGRGRRAWEQATASRQVKRVTGHLTADDHHLETSGRVGDARGHLTADHDHLETSRQVKRVTGHLTADHDHLETSRQVGDVTGHLTADHDHLETSGQVKRVTGHLTADHDHLETSGQVGDVRGHLTADHDHLETSRQGGNVYSHPTAGPIVETTHAITWLVGDTADPYRRQAVKAAIFRWRKDGQLTSRGVTKRGTLWSLTDIQAALDAHVETHGAPPWDNGRGPARTPA